jgi:hypothetical protein
MIREFTVQENIDSTIIKDFLNFYKNEDKNGIDNVVINIIGKKDESSEFKGEIDPVFLSYIILFLKEYHNVSIEFILKDISLSNRAFSLKEQLRHIIFLNNELKNQISLKNSILDKETGEIYTILNPLDSRIVQSQKFIPLIYFESKLDIDNFFSKSNLQENELRNRYNAKLKQEIIRRTKKSNENPDLFLQDLNVDELCFFETCLFNLLLFEDIYEGRNVKDSKKEKIIEHDRNCINKYKQFVIDISKGVKELALNVIEHSSDKRGVITCRLFEKDRIMKLKDESERAYLNQIDDNYFLDLNVLDLGEVSVRKTYLSKLRMQKGIFNELEILQDIKIIDEKYNYEDFFIVNFEKFMLVTHQQNKLISRYGLHYFTYVIKENHLGFIKTSSCEEGVYFYKNIDGNDIKNTLSEFCKYGTIYSCIIPINKAKVINQYLEDTEKTKDLLYDINSFIELDKLKIIDVFCKSDIIQRDRKDSEEIIYNIIFSDIIDLYKDKYEQLNEIYVFIKDIAFECNKIIILDAEQLKYIDIDSQWVRLLSILSIIVPDLIIYNLKNSILLEIIRIRRSVSDSDTAKFWNDESRILFYTYKESTDIYDCSYRRFGATLLTGASINSFYLINSNIWRHHYAFRKEFFINNGINYSGNGNVNFLINDSKLFYKSGLLFFELLLKTKDKGGFEVTLFERSIQYSLNKEYSTSNYNTNNKGYKILQTHFRLGSKIHIRDFYYAKRLFHNSFFITPLSYILANYLFDILKDTNDISLIGYEEYSSLLLSNLRNILQKKLERINDKYQINHNIIKDGKLLRDISNLHRNVLVIIPIASTFSTSIKLYNQLIEIFRNAGLKSHKIINQNINVILVGHKIGENSFDNVNLVQDVTNPTYSLYQDTLFENAYNWYSINSIARIVKVKTYDEKKTELFLDQKYFIPVYTEWHNAENCKLCYPGDIKVEECLIETSRTSITPNIILDFPKTKRINKYGSGILSLKDSLFFGNLIHGRNRYLYYTPSGRIVKENDLIICDWLKKLRDEVFSEQLMKYNKVVLVTPSIGCKSKFLDLVIDKIFNHTAIILSIPLSEDYIENAEALYADGLHESNFIIYVDDVLSSTNSFNKINHIVQITKNKVATGKGIDYCICLINRMTYDKEDNLILNLNSEVGNSVEGDTNRLFYFMKLNCPPIEEPDNEFPLELERERYRHLADTSSLDAVRQMFLSKMEKLKVVDISNQPFSLKRDYSNKKLFQLLVLNQLYNQFSINQQDVINCFVNDINGLKDLERIILDGLCKDVVNRNIIEANKYNLRFVVLKILCNTPQIYYKNIKSSVFYWIVFELESLRREIDKLFELHEKNTLYRIERGIDLDDYVAHVNSFFSFKFNDYSRFQKLKFLLKRSVQLKSNYILHSEFFLTINKLITIVFVVNENLVIKERDFVEHMELDLFSSQTKFNLYKLTSKKIVYTLITYIKELIDEHENKSVELEKNINKFKQKYCDCDKNGDFSHYLRLLELENNESIENFWLYILNNDSKKMTLRLDKYRSDPRYISITTHLHRDEKSFDKFLETKCLLHNSRYNEASLKEKVQRLLIGISELVGIDNVKASYLTVNFRNSIAPNPENLYLFVWSKEKKYHHDYLNDENMKDSLTFKMISGVTDAQQYTFSNIEVYKKNSQLHYRDGFIDDIEKFSEVSALCKDEEFSLLVIRISDLIDDKIKMYSQAAVTLVLERGERVDCKKMRLILLLRKSISDFLRNETSNSKFLELLENRKVQRYQKGLRHSVGNFLNYMTEIVQDYEGIEKKIDDYAGETRSSLDQMYIKVASPAFKEFLLIKDSIASQTNINMDDYKTKLPLSHSYFIDQYRTILESKNLGRPFCQSLSFSDSIAILNEEAFEDFSVPYIIRNSIIPEIIINQKKYGTSRSVNWKNIVMEISPGKNANFLEITFSNKIAIRSKDEKSGLKMCEEICNRLDGIHMKIIIDSETFNVILSLKIKDKDYEK